MQRRAHSDFRRLTLVSALIAALPGTLVAQERPTAVLPPPSLYDSAPPPAPEAAAAPVPQSTPARPTPAATPTSPAQPRYAEPAPSSRPAAAPSSEELPWYKRTWRTITGWFGGSQQPAPRDTTMVAAAPSTSSSAAVALPSTRAPAGTGRNPGYAADAPDRTIRSGMFGECVKTGMWEPSDVALGCGGGEMVAKVEERPAVRAPAPAEVVEVQPLPAPALKEEKALETEPVMAEPPPAPEPVAMPEPPAPPAPELTTLSADALFALGSHQLKPAAQAGLDEFAVKLGSMDYDTIKIAGHTDPTGSAAMNDRLSQRRAEAVKRYLVSRGVSASRIQTEGLGSSMPMVIETDCATLPRAQKIACYQPDRRVEIEVQGAKSRMAAQ
jgi:OOP family OmpA-OmpF porin